MEEGVQMSDLLGLAGQPALVVGGGYGIGRATAVLLARAGARVAVGDILPDRAAEVAKAVGGHAVVGDVTTEDGATGMVDEAHDLLGGLTRVANIVGGAAFRPHAETDLGFWEEELRFNLLHHMLVCRAAGRHMLTEGGGAIAMVASVSGVWGARNHASYGAAKAGVMSLARSLSDEWAGHGIRVNTVAPDIIATPRLVNSRPEPPEEAIAAMDGIAASEGVPMARFGRPEEIAGPLVFLLSDLASFMTGQCLVVDGGTMAHFPHGGSGAPPQRTGPKDTSS
jgi:NAD(P)-dependent dehydrogenase (short-subunit alcohol dehydrogenase family)